jgi:hypothetical protein
VVVTHDRDQVVYENAPSGPDLGALVALNPGPIPRFRLLIRLSLPVRHFTFTGMPTGVPRGGGPCLVAGDQVEATGSVRVADVGDPAPGPARVDLVRGASDQRSVAQVEPQAAQRADVHRATTDLVNAQTVFGAVQSEAHGSMKLGSCWNASGDRSGAPSRQARRASSRLVLSNAEGY